MSFNNNSDFAKSLSRITGTVQSQIPSPDGGIMLIYDDGMVGSGNDLRFLNSGVGVNRRFSPEVLGVEGAGAGSYDFFSIGPRFDPTRLNMPPNYLENGPHCHPGGEIAVVLKGSYVDVDLNGNALRTYGEGDVVFYQAGSTHRPVSDRGSEIFYIPMNGIVFGKGAEDLLSKLLKREGLSSMEGIEYASHWMVPDAQERSDLLKKLRS